MKMVPSERLCFLDQTIVGIVLLVSLQVLKTLPAFVNVLTESLCPLKVKSNEPVVEFHTSTPL